MNTPAHAVINLALLSRKERPETVVPIVAGSILPDLTMIVFYVYERVVRGMPERWIWSEGYHLAGWQALFDLFHSLPLAAVGVALALRLRGRRVAALCAAIGLHALGDLPLHHTDAHRHFFPFWDWRFVSPISYWDPRYHGDIVAPLEAAAVVIGLLVIVRRYDSRVIRAVAGCMTAGYALFWAYAVWAWG